ncbi:ATP-binding cassette domain-containing protein [Shinella oryzae]|uniref:ATP-binding cassette domain-containing protein n=1 Tax=Shinella oryzae TaxID=2871820 RepID=A0ABY9KBH5_9HYPH|nr:ATP-binding cassette domain-containing protein [Shinella oryzae]WLS05340.1 ATP-binding cassette domain-containing protein [Shinella oryzae]
MQNAPANLSRASTDAVVRLDGISKIFGGTVAVEDVSFSLHPGEVLALLGENGAGKSTCVKLLAGVYSPTIGTIEVDGKAQVFNSPADAQKLGIAVMHQHPGLFPDLSVAENIFIGHMPRSRGGIIDLSTMVMEARKVLAMVGLRVAAETRLGELSTSEQQLVEIARALSLKARVLIMDEPTAALSQREVEQLFKVVDDLRTRGVAMMFVGHRMDEIYRVSDRIAVLRDGKMVGVEHISDVSRERAIKMMVGREMKAIYPDRPSTLGNVVLDVHGLTRPGAFRDISFQVRAGEIVGFGGLVGSGRTEIARVLFGIDHATEGTIELSGQRVTFAAPREAIAAGIAYVSEDRLGQSLVLDFSILDNASLAVLEQVSPRGFFSRRSAIELVGDELKRLSLRYRSFDQPVKELSGGNQQKVVLSKWLATKPKLLILDEPTQGIDVNSKAEVQAMIASLAAEGIAVILISSEMPELLGMCNRIIVLREGTQTAEFNGGEATQEAVLAAATADETSNSVQNETASQNGADHWLDIFRRREMGLVAAIAAIVIPVAMINPRIFSAANLTAVSMDVSLLMLAALGQMLILLTRSIDLSIASTIGLAAYASASTIAAHPEIGVIGGVLTGSVVGTLAGLFNGAIITFGRIPAIVATLATLSLYRGFNSLWAGGNQISADEVPAAWLAMTGYKLFGVPLVVIIVLVIMLVASFLLNRTTVGRELFATGSNPDGAALIGIPVKRRIFLAFGLCGLLAGICGVLWASRYATVDARVATGFELTVIASAVVGGVAIRGGAGSLLGIALGAITLLVIRNGLTLVRVDPLWLQGIYGLVILVAIGIDAAIVRRSRRAGAH